jgi:hypothetical protein
VESDNKIIDIDVKAKRRGRVKGVSNLHKFDDIRRNPKELQAIIAEYLNETETAGKIPTVEGLSKKIGCSVSTLYKWEHRDDIGYVIKETRMAIEAILADAVVNGDPKRMLAYMFYLKCHGWNDKDGESQTKGLIIGKQQNLTLNFNGIPTEKLKDMALLIDKMKMGE